MGERKTALTRLTRLCQTNPSNIKYLKLALSKNINDLAFFAIEVAKETGNPIGKALSECLTEAPSLIKNNDIFVELSNLSISLVETNVVITKNILDRITLDPTAHWQSIADFSAFYAQSLLDIGEESEALCYAQKAACLYQRNDFPLSVDSLNAYSIFASILLSMEKLNMALLVQYEIVSIYQSTGLHLSTENCFDYADYLSDLCLSLSHLGKLEKAIKYGEQAHRLLQNVPALTSEALYSQLITKEILAVCYEKSEQLDLAAELLTDCLRTARDLYNLENDNYVLKLIGTLKLSAEIESRRGHQNLSISYAIESVEYAHEAYQQHPQAFYEKYTESLTALANIHIRFNQLEVALPYLQDSIALLELHSKQPETNIDGLAVALNSRITVYLEMLQHDEAIRDAYRLLLLYRSNSDFNADIPLGFKTIADCYLGHGDIFRASRSIQASIRRYQTLLEQEDYYLTDLLFALNTLSTIQQKSGEYGLSLETNNDVIRLLEQDDCYLKQANVAFYYTVSVGNLYNMIALSLEKEALNWSNELIKSARGTFVENSKQFAELLSIHAGLLQDLGNEQEALFYALEACNLYRTYASQATHYQLEFASCLNELCYLQSSLNKTDEALSTIQESIQVYDSIDLSFSYDILADQITALLHCTGLLIESDEKEQAIGSLKSLLSVQREQIIILNEDNLESDPDFFLKLHQSEVLLMALGEFSGKDKLLISLQKMLKDV